MLLSQHHSGRSTKLLYLGDSGSGKTGSLVSLVKAGYTLRILDYDNGLDSLRIQVNHHCPDKIGNVEYRTLRDPYSKTPALKGSQVLGQPKAFTEGLAMLDRWKYGDVDLGRPADWDEKTIVVIDSTTQFGKAALNWAMFMNPTAKDGRQWYFAAQTAFENTVAVLTSSDFKPNVILIAHVQYNTMTEGVTKGFPTAIGSALGPEIPRYFNSVALMDKEGTSASLKRVIRTVPTAMIDLKNPAPFNMASSLPIETGLADFFKTVQA